LLRVVVDLCGGGKIVLGRDALVAEEVEVVSKGIETGGSKGIFVDERTQEYP